MGGGHSHNRVINLNYYS